MTRYNIISTLLIFVCGIFVFFTESKPSVFDGKYISGGCTCSGEINKTCANQKGFTCKIYTLRCIVPGELTCYDVGGAGSQPCLSSISKCQNDVIQECD